MQRRCKCKKKTRHRHSLALSGAGRRTCARRRRPKFLPDTRCGSEGLPTLLFAPRPAVSEPPWSAPPLPPSPWRSPSAARRGAGVSSPRPSACVFIFFAALPSRPSRAPAAAPDAASFAAPFLRLRSAPATGFCALKGVSRGSLNHRRSRVSCAVPASAQAQPKQSPWHVQKRLARQTRVRP